MISYSLVNLFKNQKRKSIKAVQNSELLANQWLIEDKEYLSLNISLIENLEKFVAADFKLQEKDGIIAIINNFNWTEILKSKNNNENIYKKDNYSNHNSIYNDESKESKKINNNSNNDKTPSNQNIILKNKILKLKEDTIHLRSLSIECKINLLMSGESSFYIFSRCSEELSGNTAVCCISKELESARKFISFGVLEKNDNKIFCFKNLKKQEIPRQANHIKSLDISEIKFNFIDNGDNRCFVFLNGQELLNSNLLLIGDFFVPIDTQSNLMFGASGDLVSIKNLVIKHSYRNSYINYKNNNTNDSVQSCSCCIII